MNSVGKLYTVFTQWLKTRTALAKKNFDSIVKTGSRDWYAPRPETSVREYSDKDFDNEECQSAYLEMLNEGALDGDVISLRMQAAHILANERAFNLRHTSIPRLLAHGYVENIAETNGLLEMYLIDKASDAIEQAKAKRDVKLEE